MVTALDADEENTVNSGIKKKNSFSKINFNSQTALKKIPTV
jgi:hypothetical protein